MGNAETISKIATRIAELTAEKGDLEKEAVACEQTARSLRRKRAEVKQEISDLTLVLANEKVAQNLLAAQAKADADAVVAKEQEDERQKALTDLKVKADELDKLIAEAKATE